MERKEKRRHTPGLTSQVRDKEWARKTVSLTKFRHSPEFPHKFAKHLLAKRDIMERETLSLLVHTEEQFAIVKWFRDGKELLVERKRGNRLAEDRNVVIGH